MKKQQSNVNQEVVSQEFVSEILMNLLEIPKSCIPGTGKLLVVHSLQPYSQCLERSKGKEGILHPKRISLMKT